MTFAVVWALRANDYVLVVVLSVYLSLPVLELAAVLSPSRVRFRVSLGQQQLLVSASLSV